MAAFVERQVVRCVPCLKAASALITLPVFLGGSPLSFGRCREKMFSEVFSLRLTGIKNKYKAEENERRKAEC